MLNRILLTLSFALFLTDAVFAGPLEDGYHAALRGDDNEAVRIWMPFANEGLAEAQFLIGAAYDQGRGIAQDKSEAAKWYRLAGEQGDPDAQFNLGLLYDEGAGVPLDDAEAVRWYRLAANQGYCATTIILTCGRQLGCPAGVLRFWPWGWVSLELWHFLPPIASGNSRY
jgi:hypothetical protein